jgi:peptidoglycan hydrolase CwlO-like protein
MKADSLVIILLSIAVLAAGCDKKPTASERLDQVGAEAKTTSQNMKDYTFAHKDEFVANMQGQLDALNKDLEQLSAKIESSTDAIKLEAKPKMQALHDQVAQLNKKLDDARNGNESTWDSVKATSQKAFASFKDGVQQSRQWLSDKIAP